MKMHKIRPFRLWYYLRQGYATYLVFIVAVTNLMVTMYYLAIKDIHVLKIVFPNFGTFVGFVIGVGVPLSVLLGYWHYKRSGAQRSQIEIETEINPYYYKLPEGFWKEAIIPLHLQMLIMIEKIGRKEPWNDEDQKKIEEIKKNLQLLIDGHMLGFKSRNSSKNNKST